MGHKGAVAVYLLFEVTLKKNSFILKVEIDNGQAG